MVLSSTGRARNFKLKTIHPFDLSRKLQLMATLSVGKGPFPWKEDCTSPTGRKQVLGYTSKLKPCGPWHKHRFLADSLFAQATQIYLELPLAGGGREQKLHMSPVRQQRASW